MTRACCKVKNGIEKNFSRYADLYDEYADIQRMAADELIKKTPRKNLRSIIDIGCGTGNYTLLLRDKFKEALLKALDISGDMIRVARRKCGDEEIEFILADAERFDLRGGYDLITSNATFQWFSGLEASLERYRSVLAPGGSIIFSTFGPLTFSELGMALKKVLGPAAEISAGNFLAERTLAAIMKRHFSDSMVEESIIRRRYASIEELLMHIKYTGVRGSGIAGIPSWTRAVLDAVEKAYISEIGMIEASYQIFYCRGSR